jgi:K+-transporting ATPase KdpF subunit
MPWPSKGYEVGRLSGDVVAFIVVGIVLFLFLLYALLRPEKF